MAITAAFYDSTNVTNTFNWQDTIHAELMAHEDTLYSLQVKWLFLINLNTKMITNACFIATLC